ncbi:DNA-binding domain-containing protein [Marinomonas ostreistagni]|uniref:HvfC/BufC N-terminal domain-containing protein n=1 Tax=Marinomonas ostreistagni TaxID=359209 RepID=UPI00194FD51A|nr:DNA-binding domain-containing protein [Marinomonas ostreistagni]MBM6550774.1 putative DNA-binding domain-containing protein [Marinomonas ostreistagni]
MQTEFHAALWQQDKHLLRDIKARGASEQDSRFSVYRNNVQHSLIEALSDIFPVCKQLVGEAFFHTMARQYSYQTLPKSPVLSDYGDTFADFIQTFVPAQSLPYLADLCRLEYRLLQLTHQAEAATLTLAQAQQRLSQVQQPDTLQLTLSANCELMQSPYAIGSLYLAHRQATPDLSQLNVYQPEALLLTKDGLYGCCYVISQAQHAFLNALIEGHRLGEALPEDVSGTAFDLGQTLAQLMKWQVFSDIKES